MDSKVKVLPSLFGVLPMRVLPNHRVSKVIKENFLTPIQSIVQICRVSWPNLLGLFNDTDYRETTPLLPVTQLFRGNGSFMLVLARSFSKSPCSPQN
jgi:hypothetical protein